MNRKQRYFMAIFTEIKDIIAQSLQEMSGEDALDNIDGNKLVDVGKTITTGWSSTDFETCFGKIIDKVQKTIFHNDEFNKDLPILKNWSNYHGMLEKIRVETPDFTEINRFDLANYTPDVFSVSLPTVSAKYYNDKGKFDLKLTVQGTKGEYLKTAFNSETEMNKFIAYIFESVTKKLNMAKYQLQQLTICEAISEIFLNNTNINLLALYKTAFPSATTSSSNWKTDKDFLKFARTIINKYPNRFKYPSMLYNVGGYTNVTDKLHFFVNSEFVTALDSYLYADTYHENYLKDKDSEIDVFEVMPYWQGIGTADDERMKIDFIPSSQGAATSPDVREEIVEDNIVGVMFDDRALFATLSDMRIDAIYNPEIEATNYFYHCDTGKAIDLNENIVVFNISDFNPVYLTTEPLDYDKTDNKYYTRTNGTYAKSTSDFAKGWYYVAV